MAATAAAKSAVSALTPASLPTPDRRRFALSTPSRAIDHRVNAARRDLADIDLAGRWFAPHYAVPQTVACGAQGDDILAAASAHARRISQLLPGEDFAVVERSGGFAWGFSRHDHYVGYISEKSLIEAREPTHIVTERAALIFAEPSSRAQVRAVLPMGSRIEGAVASDFVETAYGFVPAQKVRNVGAAGTDPTVFAGRLIGTPYLWGGRGVGGIDCSGLVQLAFGLAGLALPRDSDQQMTAGYPVPDGEPERRGDLLFYPDHVIMMADRGEVIHASGYWMNVVREPLTAVKDRLGEPIARRRVLT